MSRSQRRREGVMQGTISLPHREQEWFGQRTAEWNALPESQQTKKIKEAAALIKAVGLTKNVKKSQIVVAKPTTIEYVVSVTPSSSDVEIQPILDLQGLTILAIFIRTCGKANASTFLTDYKASDKSRRKLSLALVMEAFRYATAPVARPVGPIVDNTITLADIRREREELEALAAAEAFAARRARRQHIFSLIAERICAEARLVHPLHLDQLIDRHTNCVMSLDEADEEYRALWLQGMPKDAGEAAVLKWKRERDMDSWSRVSSLECAVKSTYRLCVVHFLKIKSNFHVLMRKWWKQAPKTVVKPKKHGRLTTAEKIAKHNEVVKQLLPKYLVAKDLDSFTKPVDTISSVRLGNLREARGDAQVRDLNKDIRAFVERNGGHLATGLGTVFIPLNRATRSSQGYCFVKLSSPENARQFLDRVAQQMHPMLVDSRTGDEREVFPELAASDRKTKEEMEAERAKAKRVEATPDAVSVALKAALRGPGGELKPICIAQIKREKTSAAAEALKAAIAASFPALSNSAAAPAKIYENSFAAMVNKPLPEKIEVIDPFKLKLNGVEYAVACAPTTDLGRAQMALRQAVEDAVAAEERRKRRASPKMVVNAATNWVEEAK